MSQHTRREFMIETTIVAGAVAFAPLDSAGAQESTAKPEEEPEKVNVSVALLQILAEPDNQAFNLEKADRYCRKAAGLGVDIALLPEMWNIGYSGFDKESEKAKKQWQARAIARDSEFIRHFAALAKELNMAIAVAYLESWNGPPRNSVSLIDRHGKMVMTYAKVHTCDFGPNEASCTPGERFDVCELDTAQGPIKVGAMICYDREAPESARILMLNGAELILIPNACRLRPIFIDQLKIRAFENAVAVAMANYPAPKNNGHSSAFDADGSLIVEAGDAEGIYLAPFDFGKIREHRRKTIWGDAFRRPHRYHAIVEQRKIPVFERLNAFGEEFRAELR